MHVLRRMWRFLGGFVSLSIALAIILSYAGTNAHHKLYYAKENAWCGLGLQIQAIVSPTLTSPAIWPF